MIQEGTERSLREERARDEYGTRAATSSQTADARTHGWSNVASQAGKKSGRRGSECSGGSWRAVVAGSRPGDGSALQLPTLPEPSDADAAVLPARRLASNA